jgi:hypothetical protein
MSPEALIVVNHDVRGTPIAASDLTGTEAVLITSPGGYGDFTHIDRYLAAVRHLDAVGEHFDWICNLSGQDYPVTHLDTVERELASTSYDALVELFPVFAPESHWSRRTALTRYHYRYRSVGTPSERFHARTRWLAAVNRVQPWVRFSPAYARLGRRTAWPFDGDLTCYGGSFFTNLSRRALDTLVQFVDERPEVVAWARGVLAPEEMFVQTVLANSPGLRLQADNRRYYDFAGSVGNHPRVLDLSDVATVVAGDAWFARKFTPDSPALDAIDDHLARGPLNVQ